MSPKHFVQGKIPLQRVLTWCAAALILTLASVVALAGVPWEETGRDDNVITWKRWPDGQALPTLRGQADIKASVSDVAHALTDTKRFCDWMPKCKRMKVLGGSAENLTVYIVLNAPFPLDDRDVVVRQTVRVRPDKGDVFVEFKKIADKLMPETDDAVRMPMFKGYYSLKPLANGGTRVLYQADSDVGGLVPDFVVRRASENIPREVLTGLRAQSIKMTGKYAPFPGVEKLQ